MIVTLSNGVQLTFTITDGELHGLSQAVIDDIPLIAEGNLRLPRVETRDGWVVDSLRFTGHHEDADGLLTLTCEAWANKPPIGRKLDMFQFPYITTPRPATRLGTFRWLIRPETVDIGTPSVRVNSYHGFSYSYAFELNRAFHWILDAGTWEAGGDPEGMRIISKHMHPCAGPMEGTISRQGRSYSTAEAFIPKSSNEATTVPDIPADPSLGFILPLQAQLRGAGGSLIDAHYTDDAIVFGYFEQTGYYRTLIEWRVDDPGIGHLDHHFFPLSTTFTTAPKTILAAKVDQLTRIEALNRWTDVWEHVATAWRNQVGVRRFDPIICYSMTWITHEPCWGHPPDDMMARNESVLDWMQENGFNCLYSGHWGGHRGLVDPETANACEPDSYEVLEQYGGAEAFSKLCKAAHARGIKVSMWLCFHLSLRGPTLKEHPEWVMRYDSAAPWDGNYRIMASCSLRSGYREWLLNQLRDLKEQGLDMVFIDSYNNLSASPIDYGDPALPPHMPALLDFQGECQAIGLDCMIETVGPIGVTACGFWPEYLESPELGYWSHYRCKRKLLYDGTLDETSFLRMMANKSPLGGISSHFHSEQPHPPAPELPDYVSAINHLYLQLAPTMQVRTLHEDGSIAWHNPETDKACLFAIGTGSVTVPAGYRAEPLYKATLPLPAGTHTYPGIAAFALKST